MDASNALEFQLTILKGRSKMCLFVGGPPEESEGVLGVELVEEEEEEVEEEELELQDLKLEEDNEEEQES